MRRVISNEQGRRRAAKTRAGKVGLLLAKPISSTEEVVAEQQNISHTRGEISGGIYDISDHPFRVDNLR